MRKHLVLLTVFAACLALASKASAQNPRQAMKQICLAPYIRPLIFGFSNRVSGAGGRMFNA